MKRARWLALGLILGLATLAWGQGGPGFFMSPSCSSIANPATGSTVCWQSSPPNSWFFWDGAAFSSPTLGGPYAPTTLLNGGVLIGGGTGPITATLTPTVSGLTTTTQAALALNPYGASTNNTGEIRFMELAANGTEYVAIQGANSVATSYSIKLPSIPGTAGQCLGTDGGSPLVTAAWVACSPGAGSGITTLNSLTAVTQTFANDTNVTMVSATSTHTLTWAGTLAVARGGLGVGTLAANGVLVGNGTSAVVVTAAGAADEVLRVPGAGGTPAFGAVDVSKAAAITGLVRTANLGSGSATTATFLRGDQTWAAGFGVPTYNFVFNSDMELWGKGTSAEPTGWVSAGGAFARDGTNFKTGTASVAITRSTGTAAMTQTIRNVYPTTDFWRSQVVTCGAWVRATVASTTYLRLEDGVGQTDSSFHSGGSTFEFLTVSRSISNVATTLIIRPSVATTNTTSQFDSVTCVLGSSVANWQPSGWLGRKGTIQMNTVTAALAAGTTQYFGFFGPVTGGAVPQASVGVPVPFRKAVVRNCNGLLSAAPGGAETATFTLRVNESPASPLPTFVITGAATQASDVVNEMDVVLGNRLSARVVTSAAAVASNAVMTCELEEMP